MILLVSDIGEHKANPKRNASGTVIESSSTGAAVRWPPSWCRTARCVWATPSSRGRSSAACVRSSTTVAADQVGAAVRAGGSPWDCRACRSRVTPSRLADAAKARQIATYRQAREEIARRQGSRLTLESLQQQIAEGNMKDLPILIRSRRAGLIGSAGRHAGEAQR
jgi:translation initiation factor IF-2